MLIDLYVPVVDRVYDFQVDETKAVQVVLDDIADMICQKEQWQMKGESVKLSLWSVDGHRKLEKSKSLIQNGIRSGMQLILV